MEVKWPLVRRAVLEVTRPALKLVGHFHTPPHYRSITSHEVDEVAKTILPGDVLLSHRDNELTNPVIPGYWKHAAMFIGDGKIIEATGKGVNEDTLQEFLETKDGAVVLRATFATVDEAKLAVGFAKTLKGLPYDYLVEHDFSRAINKAFYCSEIPWWSYEQVFAAGGHSSPFTPRATMGVPTIAPQDYRNATKLWRQVMLVRGEGN